MLGVLCWPHAPSAPFCERIHIIVIRVCQCSCTTYITSLQAGQNVLIQSGPGSDAGDALLATASHAAIPSHMNVGLIKMKDQERIDRQAVTMQFLVSSLRGMQSHQHTPAKCHRS